MVSVRGHISWWRFWVGVNSLACIEGQQPLDVVQRIGRHHTRPGQTETQCTHTEIKYRGCIVTVMPLSQMALAVFYCELRPHELVFKFFFPVNLRPKQAHLPAKPTNDHLHWHECIHLGSSISFKDNGFSCHQHKQLMPLSWRCPLLQVALGPVPSRMPCRHVTEPKAAVRTAGLPPLSHLADVVAKVSRSPNEYWMPWGDAQSHSLTIWGDGRHFLEGLSVSGLFANVWLTIQHAIKEKLSILFFFFLDSLRPPSG